MKVVLRTDVEGVGYKGDIVDISDGFAQNKLIPKGLAFKATAGAQREAERMRKSRELKAAEERSVAEEIASRLTEKSITISMNAGEGGKLFGSVTTSDIANALETQANVTLDRKDLQLSETIKEIGTYEVMARPHPDVEFSVTIEVVADSE
ncbi:MAG: 50S ribosomal protein L9 [Acidimicrobiaceae bacterium]|nr:50S ribosomal protein L9 [Acidimicrobiaceae bacterium]